MPIVARRKPTRKTTAPTVNVPPVRALELIKAGLRAARTMNRLAARLEAGEALNGDEWETLLAVICAVEMVIEEIGGRE